MKRLRKIAKLVGVNVLVFLILIWSLNLLASVVLDGIYLVKRISPPVPEKAYRPSLPDRELAERVFRERNLPVREYVPFVGWSRRPFEGEVTTVNEQGDRSHPPTTDRPTKVVRFFGGSTMWGTGVDDRNTIPALFNARHPDFHVANHGESGFVSRQEVARLTNLVNQDAPMDLVVFYDGCNDSISLCRWDVSIDGHREQGKFAHKLNPRWRVADALLGSIRLVILELRKVRRKARASRCEEDPDYGARVARTLVNNWKIARSIAETGGARFHAILQPVASLGNAKVDYMGPRGDGAPFRSVYTHVQEIARREKIDWIHDFTDAFDVEEYIYIDACHVNAVGNQIIAGRIDEAIRLNGPTRRP